MTEKHPCVYILASKRNGTLYVGVTSDLARRVWEHRSESVEGFTKDYRVHNLVFFEFHESMAEAILREKHIGNGGGRGKSSFSKKRTRNGSISTRN